MAGNDEPSSATFLLTRNAALDLRRIHTRSCPNGVMTLPISTLPIYTQCWALLLRTQRRVACGNTVRLSF